MRNEIDKLMENIKAGQPCPANCGGTIEEVDYSKVGRGVFLQCNKNGTTHFKRISPINPETTVAFKLFQPKAN